ncbi:MAG: molybdopterin-dependent oxidoreductase [bacterium]|nr:molybdopterin-dependent oxidoreductase [bacterium]
MIRLSVRYILFLPPLVRTGYNLRVLQCFEPVGIFFLIAGAMRGYASCHVHFAHDVHMGEVAEALGIDPVELRRINASTPNYTRQAVLG